MSTIDPTARNSPNIRRSDPPAVARRALDEAAARRAEADKMIVSRPTEVSGREGPDPVRYGDWEAGGRAVDF